jgi:hypothetical protein
VGILVFGFLHRILRKQNALACTDSDDDSCIQDTDLPYDVFLVDKSAII